MACATRSIVPHAPSRQEPAGVERAPGATESQRVGRTAPPAPSDRRTLGAQAGELDVERLVAAVDVVQAAHLGRALGDQAGDGERGAAAQVGGFDDAAGELTGAGDHGVVAARGDAGAQAVELVDHGEAVLEDVLGDDRGALGEREGDHELRLQVGGKAGVRQRRDVDRAQRAERARADLAVALVDLHAHGAQLVQEELETGRVEAADGDVAAGGHAGQQVGAGLDAVGDDLVDRAVQLVRRPRSRSSSCRRRGSGRPST